MNFHFEFLVFRSAHDSWLMEMLLWIFVLHAVCVSQFGGDAALLEARQHAICAYQLNGYFPNGLAAATTPDCFLRNLTSVAALSVDVRDRWMVFSDVGDNVTYKVDLGRTPPVKEPILHGWGKVEGIAVDWVAKNVFWTDSDLQHVAVCRYDGSHRHIIIFEDIGHPRGIAVHPPKGYLFWSDTSPISSRIERTDMAGQSRKTLLSYSLINPNGLTVDHDLERLYFVDSGNDNIEYVNFDGKDRTFVQHESRGDFFGIASTGNFLFVSSFTPGMESGTISSVFDPRREGEEPTFYFRTVTHPGYSLDLSIDDVTAQPGTTGPCGDNNGGCQQLCLPVDGSSFQCSCGTGYTLETDGVTCGTVTLSDPFILVGDGSLNRIFQVDAHASYSAFSALPVEDMTPTGVAYDPIDAVVYWTDATLGRVSRTSLNGTTQEDVASGNIRKPTGIAVDPFRRLVYWADEARRVIERANMYGRRRSVYVSSGLEKPRGVAVDPSSGVTSMPPLIPVGLATSLVFGSLDPYGPGNRDDSSLRLLDFASRDLFWSDCGAAPKIERISEDSQGRVVRVVLVDSRLSSPNGIAVDPEANLLYWCDAAAGGESRIEVASLDGRGRRTLLSLSTSSRPYSLAIHGKTLFYSDWGENALSAVERFHDAPRAHHFGPRIFMRMHGLASSYYADPSSYAAPLTPLPPAAGSNSSKKPPATEAELPTIIVVGGSALLVVLICFTVATVFLRQRTKARRRTNLQTRRPSRQPTIPIPPIPTPNGAAGPLPEKMRLSSDHVDPITGEHVYMDVDNMTAYHESKGAPPPYSPPRPDRSPLFFHSPPRPGRGHVFSASTPRAVQNPAFIRSPPRSDPGLREEPRPGDYPSTVRIPPESDDVFLEEPYPGSNQPFIRSPGTDAGNDHRPTSPRTPLTGGTNPRRDSETGIDHSYFGYQGREKKRRGSSQRRDSFQDTYNPTSDAEYQTSIEPLVKGYPATDYMDLSNKSANNNKGAGSNDDRGKPRYSIPSEYIEHNPAKPVLDDGTLNRGGPQLGRSRMASNGVPLRDEHLASTEDMIRRERERSRIEANLRRSGYTSP